MNLAKRIEQDFVAAYKNKEELKLAVLRLLKTAIKNHQVELRRELDEGEVLDIVTKQAKQRQESITQYEQAGRQDLAEVEAKELVLLKEYLPQQLTPEETEALVEETISALGAEGMKDMGRVMQAITADYKGRVDGKALSSLVRARLSA